MYYEINEDAARRGHEQNHMSDYRDGDATRSYRAQVDSFAAAVASAKSKTESSDIHERLDRLLGRYAKRLAEWINSNAANDARHVSWFVAGSSNYDMRKHKKWSDKNDTLMREWSEIDGMRDEIGRILRRKDIIMSGDANAVERIEAKIAEIREQHAGMKAQNAAARKEGKEAPIPGYELAYALANIKRLEVRLKALKAVKFGDDGQGIEKSTDGVRMVENGDLMRIQVFFDEKPDSDVRDALKQHGFKWAPSNGAWQRQLTDNGRRAAAEVMKIITAGGAADGLHG